MKPSQPGCQKTVLALMMLLISLLWFLGLSARGADNDFCGDLCPSITVNRQRDDDRFGSALAALGTEFFAVGLPGYDLSGITDRGIVYVYDTNGANRRIINNPYPANGDQFGFRLAALDSSRFLVGAPFKQVGTNAEAGMVFLYRFVPGSATLLTTITNPAPKPDDWFGYSLGAAGDYLVIGAPFKAVGTNVEAGLVYVYQTNGALVRTITNSSPRPFDHFGQALAATSPTNVIIAAPDRRIGTNSNAGRVYFYDTNGVQLATIQSPSPKPGDKFGHSLARIGTNRLAVGSIGVDHITIAETNQNAGAVYLYDVNGTFLKTIPNPFPREGAYGDWFGYTLAAVGTDRFLIGARIDHTWATEAGSAYLYNANGDLFATINNPDPNASDHFSQAMAGVGTDWFAIGVPDNDPEIYSDSGTVHLYYAPIQEYLLGREIPRPALVAAEEIPATGPEIEPAGAAFWHRPSEFEAKLYATRAGKITIHWKPGVSVQALNVWPPNEAEYQLHIANSPPVDLRKDGQYTAAHLMESEASTGLDLDRSNLSQGFRADGPGRSLLVLSSGDPKTDPIYFQLVKSVTWDDLAHLEDNLPATIGDEIVPPLAYHDTDTGSPFVFWFNSFYCADANYYDRANRTGPVIPVNRDQPGTVTDDMVLVYYKKSTTLKDAANGGVVSNSIAWPWKAVRYRCDWPSNADTLVIADGRNRKALPDQTYVNWDIYVQNDASKPGFNPNDEHALQLAWDEGYAVFPLRDDLGTATTSEPYVLIKYYDGSDGLKSRMRVFKVVAGTFNIPLLAGQLIQPPVPLGLFQQCPESIGVSGRYWQDRKEDFWAKAAGDDGRSSSIVMRYFYRVQSGFYFPSNYLAYFPDNILKTNLPPAGTCFPWLDIRGGSLKTPHDINYTVNWPEAPPALSVGETLVKPKNGLPDISSQSSVEIIYQQAEALSSSKSSVVLIDPTRERQIPLDSLPIGVETIQRGDKHFFPKLPPHLRERLFWDETEKMLNLKGELVEPPLGEAYLLLNLLTDRDKMLVNEAYPLLSSIVADPEFSSLIKVGPLTTVFDSLALTAGNATGTGYVTIAFGNNPKLSPPAEPVSLAVIRVECPIYVGEIKVVESDNPFDELLTLRHSGDFAGKADQYQFEWRYRGSHPDGTPPSFAEIMNGDVWALANGAVDIVVKGPGVLTLGDKYFVCRYRPLANVWNWPCTNAWSDWTPVQLAEGWIKRVLKGINPFEQRFKDYQNNPINTLVSMISQAGPRYEGDAPLSLSAADKFGLIQIYETVLRRGKMLSIHAGYSDPDSLNAILLASGRLADLYMLLGNEAFADAADPTIGFGTADRQYGTEASSIHCFMNQTASLLEEELALLRGRDDSRLPPVSSSPIYNRLAWNFTRDINGGEVAYALNYNIRDENGNVDGAIDEDDAKVLYPQGHGDAWGHYLTAIKYYYSLLTHTNFAWKPRTESILLGGVPASVDYLDERKFAQAAAAKARTGAEIVDLTYRSHYVEDPAGQWQGYQDVNPNRAWGLAEWGSRAGQGALFDWAVANAMLPGTSTNSGIQKVDRTTVMELREISVAFEDIQAKMDIADLGLNPLGLAKNVVSFDIDPSLVEQGRTHFEQIYDRAVLAMNNVTAVFNHAYNSTQLLRRQADTLNDFQISVEDREADFKNRLIEVFGYPYSDDIGPRGAYPSGYDGPDLFHFDYFDVSELLGKTPPLVEEKTVKIRDLDVDEDGGLTKKNRDVTFYISANGFGLIKPPTWTGTRRAPGEIQFARSDLVQTKARFEKAISDYTKVTSQIEDQARLLKEQHNVNKEEIQVINTSKDTLTKLNDFIKTAKEREMAFRTAARKAQMYQDALAEAMPLSTGWSFDITSIARSALRLLGAMMNEQNNEDADVQSLADLDHQQSKELDQARTNIKLTAARNDFAIEQSIAQLEQLVRQEPGLRLEIYTLNEAMGQSAGRYRAALARGHRLLEDRLRFRQQTAVRIQEYRYKDMAFRIFRNDALQKYRAQFDLAALYACLAAKAYDYETCLLPDDPRGPGENFITDIIRSRSLGLMDGGQPRLGSGRGDPGLADALARMYWNWVLVLDGQLGFNNPQTETGRFSLRTELFRIQAGSTNNPLWRETLSRHVVANVFELPEFQRYCIPFYPHLETEPGIVIPFSSTINFGQNLFGWPAGGGDNDYDSTHFATKIRSVGVWFANYNNLGGGMVNTPRVYLIPVGNDVLRSPTHYEGITREWKILDQAIPVPFPVSALELLDPDWIPMNDTLFGELSETRKFSRFRAYHDSGSFTSSETVSDSRLIGRSVWNTRWLLIIPAGTLHSDRNEGLQRFIHGPLVNGQRTGNGVTDIKVFFQTYAYSGN